MSAIGRILVVGEADGGGPTQQTLELVAAARAISNDSDVLAAFTGIPGSATPELPVNTVYTAVSDRLGDEDSATFDAATDTLTALAKDAQPDVILFARTEPASVVAPRLALRLGSSFARDCTGIEATGDATVVTRPVYGGNANARYRLNGEYPHVIMIRPGVFEPISHEAQAQPQHIEFDPTPHIGDARSTLIRTVQEPREGVLLEDAEVVVSGGRGLGGPEPFAQLAELADLLGGAVGASRAACDAGWIDHSHQVGLTGKSVSPKLYLSFGISGASQHMAGCSSARNIVAVNTDPEASIFTDARFGVVGDWSKVLPALVSALRDIG